ncbi:MAG: site-specific integrase [Pseudomonadota bacterium]
MPKRSAIHLTADGVNSAKPQDKPYEIRDAGQPGLLLRVQPSGSKSWVIVYTVNGRKTRKVIGDARKLGVKAARTKAKKPLATAEAGKDPYLDEKAAQSALLGKYLDGPYKAYAEAHILSHADLLPRLRRNWGHLAKRSMAEITPLDVQRWRKRKMREQKPVSFETLQRELTYLKAMLGTAQKIHKLIPSHQLQGYTLTRESAQLEDKKSKGPRYLDATEEIALRHALEERDLELRSARESMREWQRARKRTQSESIKDEEYPDHITPIVLLALNTGLRRGDLFSLEWRHVDFSNKQIRKVIDKTRRKNHDLLPAVLPLSAEAMRVLTQWKKQSSGSDLVFPSPVTGGKLNNIKKAWEGLMTSSGIQNFRFHDLRHTFASKLVMAGIPLNTVRELMTHSDPKMTLVYAHLSPSHMADAIDQVFGS